MKRRLSIACATAFSLLAAPVFAQSLKEDGIKQTLAKTIQATPDNHFKIGALQTLSAIENMVQTRWRYNIGHGMTAMPLMRLNLAYNKAGEPATPDAISSLARGFLADISKAKTSLEAAKDTPDAEFLLSLGDLWFDVNGNGTREPNEALKSMSTTLLRGMFMLRGDDLDAAYGATIRFDASDVHWLHAYTEMLSGTAHLYLAFDPADAFRALGSFHAALEAAPQNKWGYSKEEASKLLADLDAQREKLLAEQAKFKITAENRKTMKAARQALQNLQKAETKDAEQIEKVKRVLADLVAENDAKNAARRDIRREMAVLRANVDRIISLAPPMDEHERARSRRQELDMAFVFISALDQDPDPIHTRAALASFKGMIASNKRFWELLEQESDNDREWIPNENQTAVLGFELPKGTGALWQTVLSDVEKTLNGELLIPHFFMPKGVGINLESYAQNPVALDLVGSIHGSTFAPFIEKGPQISEFSWEAFNRSLGRNSMLVAVLLN